MLFDRSPRFEEDYGHDNCEQDEGSGTLLYPQKSTLSNKGTRMVDSYVQRPIGDRYETNLMLKDGMFFHAQNDSPNDMFKYSPNTDLAKPRVICPKWSDTERFPPLHLSEAASLGPYEIRGEFDKVPPSCQSPVKYFGSSERYLKFVTECTKMNSQCVSAENSVYEEPSFADYTYCTEDGDEGSYLSLDSADKSYRAIQQNTSACKIGVRLRNPPPDNVHVPGPGQYDVKLPPPTQLGIKLKGRLNAPKVTTDIPGPNSYDTSAYNAIATKSFNKSALASMRAAARNLVPHKPPGAQPTRAASATDRTDAKGRRVRSSAAVRPGGAARQRNVVDASAFLAQKAGQPAPMHSSASDVRNEVPTSVSSREQGVVHKHRPHRPAVPEGPPAHVSKQEVRSARDFFGSILQTTNKIITTPEPVVVYTDKRPVADINTPES